MGYPADITQEKIDNDLVFIIYNLVYSDTNKNRIISVEYLFDWFEKNNLKVNPECIKKELNFLADLCLIRDDSSDGYEIV